jgi:LppX_LprAFG lipoprotein
MVREARQTVTFGLTGAIIAMALVATPKAQGGQGRAAPQGHLNRAADAILKLTSAQFTIQREGSPAFLDEKTGVTFTTAQCLYAAPDRVSCDVKITSKTGTVLQLTRVWVPEGTFQSNPLTRQFVKVPPDAVFNGALLFAKTGIPEILQNGVAKPQLAGSETVREKNTLHLKGEVKGERLIPFMGALFAADQLYPVDLWMEDQTGNPVRMHVSESGGNGWMIDLFSVNTPVDIPTPKVPVAPAPLR